ncbi:MAG TPA: Do family serine endopeptidase [Bacteroidia bacterium]|nr:Do family serine endopeptidase [Bacteroidia bacterium]HNT79754.1 Do family serine endopeptidase [Bacteroidia bacterium]
MKKKLLNFLVMFLIALTGGGIGAYYFIHTSNEQLSNNSIESFTGQLHRTSYPGLPENGINFTNAAESTLESVVHVKTLTESRAGSYYDPFSFFFGDRTPRNLPPQQGSGSGVILSNDGFIVTNNHVINGADKISVTLHDRREFEAKLIGADPATDVALLKIDQDDLKSIAFGNSDQIQIGEWVLAVGNPFNLTSTVTAGIVSAKARNINIIPEQSSIEAFIQTDAAVNPGNSGGALVNTKGELMGINTAIASTTGAYAGYSFAIPANIVRKVVDDLAEFGTVQRAYIGVGIQNVDAKIADEKGLKLPKGIYVNRLTDGGAALDAGLEIGDVITEVNKVKVDDVAQLLEQIGRYRPGDKVNIVVHRNGKPKEFLIELKNRMGTTKLVKNEEELFEILGAELSRASDNDLKNLKVKSGVKVNALQNGRFKSAGIREGFIITSINNESVETPDEVVRMLQNNKGGILIGGFYPNGVSAYYGLGM